MAVFRGVSPHWTWQRWTSHLPKLHFLIVKLPKCFNWSLIARHLWRWPEYSHWNDFSSVPRFDPRIPRWSGSAGKQQYLFVFILWIETQHFACDKITTLTSTDHISAETIGSENPHSISRLPHIFKIVCCDSLARHLPLLPVVRVWRFEDDLKQIPWRSWRNFHLLRFAELPR